MAKLTKIKAKDDEKPTSKEKPDQTKPSEAKTSTAKKQSKSAPVAKANTKELKASSKKSDKASPKASKKLTKAEKKAAKAEKKAAKKAAKSGRRIPVISYLKECFAEIRQVRWPNRKETWKMTLSVIGYVLVISIFITLLDAVLTLIFNKVLTLGN